MKGDFNMKDERVILLSCYKEMNQVEDNIVEKLWTDLNNVPFTENNNAVTLLQNWKIRVKNQIIIFYKGTNIQQILNWFGKNHSKGLGYLMTMDIKEGVVTL